MALTPVYPFEERVLLGEVRPFIEWVLNHVQTIPIDGRVGWLSHLHSYSWGGDWRRGVADRLAMAKMLEQALKKDAAHVLNAANKVAKWGGVHYPPILEDRVCWIRQSFAVLDQLAEKGANKDWNEIHADRIATVSKIYEMYDLGAWVIYDSRAATGLARLVRAWWASQGEEALDCLLRFPIPPSKGGRRLIPGFPGVAKTAPKQARLGFLYSSWLSKALAERLGDQVPAPCPGSRWWPYHVEMIMFMLGERIHSP